MPQIAQLSDDSWYLVSQIFWLLVVFAVVYFVVGRMMLPKIEATIDARDRRIVDDLAAAKAAHDAAAILEEECHRKADTLRAEAQKASQAAKDKAARETEKRLAKIDAELAAKFATAEAELRDTKTEAMANVESIASEAARDLVVRLSGVKVKPEQADKAVEVVLHG